MRNLFLIVALIASTTVTRALEVHLEVYATDCDGNNGAIIATALNGDPPYAFNWSDGSAGSEIYGLSPGTYSVTVVDNTGASSTATCEVFFGGAPPTGSGLTQNLGFPGLAPCTGQCNGGVRLYLLRQFGGYTISTSPNLNVVLSPIWDSGEPDNVSYYQRYELLGACAGQTIQLSVNSSCGSGEVSFTVPALIEPTITVGEVTGSCTGANNGTIAGEVTVVTEPLVSEDSWTVRAVDDLGLQVAPIPNLPFHAGTETFQIVGLHPGDWTLRFTSIESMGSAQQPCVIDVPVTVPDLGTACATVSGTVHYETDVDCLQDGLEVGIPYQLLKATPGPVYGITSGNGAYSIGLPYGAYALEQLNPDAAQLCPPAGPIAFTVSNGNNAVVNIADSTLSPFDLSVFALQGISRVGFPFTFSVRLINNTGASGENVSVTLYHDPLFTFIGGTQGAVASPGQVQWTIPVIAPFEQRWLQVTVQVPPDPLLTGTVHYWSATATTTSNESTTANNTFSSEGTIVASYDPNDKVGTANISRSTEQFYLDQDLWIDYVVRFQNTGSDTAFTVVIRDIIEQDLDIESLQILGASHAFTPSFGEGRELVFTFNDILLPDSTTDLLGSQGFVAFRLKPRNGLVPGDVITNTADIYFDFNEPVITEPSVLVAEFSTGVHDEDLLELDVFPNPTDQRIYISTNNAPIALLTITRTDGRIVLRQAADGALPEVDIQALIAGAYFVEASLANGQVLRGRFIKN
ncbi:MAG: T9SS type A sorting domain-containing protein [Flavobacteriales bacterium]|nr:T9SS type A sorting domain-containing protein [Flavobacteriales bacterium]